MVIFHCISNYKTTVFLSSSSSSSWSWNLIAIPATRSAEEEGWVSAAGWARSSAELAAGRTSPCTSSLFQPRAHSSSDRQPVQWLPKERADHVAANRRSPRKTSLSPITVSQSSAPGSYLQFLHNLSGSHSRALICHICFHVRTWTGTEGDVRNCSFIPVETCFSHTSTVFDYLHDGVFTYTAWKI